MDAQSQCRIEARIEEICRELGLSDPTDLTSGRPAAEHDLEDFEELYAERERLLQELEKDC
jgi:hypothetical protein